MNTQVIIARHGNTFEKGETPRRVGSKTDIPLVEKGFQQGKYIGLYLKHINWTPDLILHGPLLRHIQTTEEAIKAAHWSTKPQLEKSLDEIDYGPDENKTDDDVNNRLGKEALEKWDQSGAVPAGWNVNPEAIKQGWKSLFSKLENSNHQRILIITSNGTARFALSVLENDPGEFLKLGTGKLGRIELSDEIYTLKGWNIDPRNSK